MIVTNTSTLRTPYLQQHTSQLGRARTRLFQDGLCLGRLHHVARDLETAGHVEALSIGLSGDEFGKVIVV